MFPTADGSLGTVLDRSLKVTVIVEMIMSAIRKGRNRRNPPFFFFGGCVFCLDGIANSPFVVVKYGDTPDDTNSISFFEGNVSCFF